MFSLEKNCARLFKIGMLFLVLGMILQGTGLCQERAPVQISGSLGIGTTPEKLALFLEKGLPEDYNQKAFSELAIPATQLAILAMQEIAKANYTAALPVLIQTAEGRLTTGQKALVQYDIQKVSRSFQEARKNTLYDFLQYNAMNTLGLMRDPGVLPVLRGIFQNTSKDLFKINLSLGMATLDDPGGIPYLVDLLEARNRSLAVEGAAALSLITGMEIDYTRFTPIIRRKRAIEKIGKWWKDNRESFHPRGEEILKRRLNVQPLPPPSLRSVREMLMAASDYADVENSMKSLDAREKLSVLGASILPEVLPLCVDEEEDINIRIEALRFYSRLASKEEAIAVLKKASHDNNPEIKSFAKELLKSLKRSGEKK
jgi:hypothetical protein